MSITSAPAAARIAAPTAPTRPTAPATDPVRSIRARPVEAVNGGPVNGHRVNGRPVTGHPVNGHPVTGRPIGARPAAPALKPGLVRLKVSVDDTARRELSEREIEVLTLIAAGGTKGEISRELGIAPRTVASHMSRIYRALGARNAAHAVALAHGSGTIQLPARRQPVPGPAMSRREREVLAGLAHGLTSAQVAWCLSLSSETVKTHLRRIYRKLEVSCRANAVDAAIRRRLLAVVLEPRGGRPVGPTPFGRELAR
ncbi:MAG: response regulator transcription factor [Catenulispora sp.]